MDLENKGEISGRHVHDKELRIKKSRFFGGGLLVLNNKVELGLKHFQETYRLGNRGLIWVLGKKRPVEEAEVKKEGVKKCFFCCFFIVLYLIYLYTYHKLRMHKGFLKGMFPS